MSNKNSEYYFLRGGGEMGALIRAKDWSKTALGDPADWPQSLRTMVAVMLDNPFGMYIAWGSEYIQLYNDGYRPILGATKHPQALGISTRETFSEIWNIIESMFDGVMKGKAVGFPDLMLPLNRNGFVEECYFDFSYSPIRKDNGEVGGVLVTVIETTNKKKAQAALIENTTQLKFAMDAAELGYWDYNPANDKFTANNRLKTWFGLSASEEIELHHATDSIAEKDRDRIIMAITKALDYSSGGIYEEEYSIINPFTNKEIIVQAKGRAWFNEERIAYRFNGILQEVTENVLARKKVEESEQRFKLALSGGNQIVFSQDENLKHTWLHNPHPDFNLRDIIGKTDDELHSPSAARILKDIKQKVLDTGKAFNGDIEIEVSGVKANYTMHIEAIKDSDQNITGIIGTGIDITERIKTLQRIKESEQRFQAAIQAVQGILWTNNAKGEMEGEQPGWASLTGQTFEEYQGYGWTNAVHPDDAASTLKGWEEAVKERKIFICEHRVKRKDGQWRDFSIRAIPLSNADGTLLQWVGVHTDITEQKKAEEQFRVLADQAPMWVWLTDKEVNVLYANSELLRFIGISHYTEFTGQIWEQKVHPDDIAMVYRFFGEAVSLQQAFSFEFRVQNAMTHQYEWFYIKAVPRLESDKFTGFIGTGININEQRLILSQLEYRQALLEAHNEATIDGILLVDAKGRILSYNHRFVEIWQMPQRIVDDMDDEAALAFALTQLVHPRQFMEKVKWLYEHPDEISMDELEFKDGKIIERHGYPVTSPDGSYYAWSWRFRDITEQRKSERIIKESEERFRSLAQELEGQVIERTAELTKNNIALVNKTIQLEEAQKLAHIGSWEWDVQTNEINWSDELYRIFGLTPQEFKSDYENYLKYIHPDDREYVNSIVQQALKDHQPYAFFHKAVWPDGQVRILRATGKVFTDGVGNVIRMSGTAQDVTEQKKYEEELKTSEERFFKIFDSNPIPMTLSEIKTNKIKYANNLFYNAFGYTKEEVIGNSSEELNLIDPEEYKRVIDLIFGYINENRSLTEVQALSKEETETLLLRLKQSEKMKNFEICYTRKKGEKFPAIVSFELIKIGTESYTVTSYQDITERKKSETQLKNQNDQLEKMNKELESFAYVSSHDLQEPLRKIQTFASRITEKEENNLSAYGKDMFNRMRDAAKRMQTLIQDLLAYSRTSTADQNLETADLNKLIAEVKEDLKEELKEKHATVDANQLCEVAIIPFQFRQLMHNLIGNSLKFSNPNHPPLIQISSEIARGINLNNEKLSPQNKYCHIKVSDNGIGFEQQYGEKIFEVFQRLHGKNEYNGTGIGLSIVKKIVENHNGIITATGELDKGATFDIYIPST